MRRLLYVGGIIGVVVLATPHFLSASNAQALPVPFVVQAPHGNWDQPYQDACEEASITMLRAYYQGDDRANLSAAESDRMILDLVATENEILGYNRDTSLADVARVINDFYPFEAYVVSNPTLEDVKREIDHKRPVVLPVWGRFLTSNPHFSPPGPTYHTIVIIGYDDAREQFITHEPGTRYGAKFRYGYSELMDNLQDFVPGADYRPSLDVRVKHGLFTRGILESSGLSDADGDGLQKTDELSLHTSLRLRDTDHDGYSDGKEVEIGYSPTIDEYGLNAGTLVKTADDPRVYVLEGGKKRHILNERAFEKAGYDWSDIVVVSDRFIHQITSL